MMANKENRNTDDKSDWYYWGGIILMGVGVLLIMANIHVSYGWYTWRLGSFGIPTGVTVIPLLIGIGMWFYKPNWIAAKVVLAVSLLFLLITLLLGLNLHFNRLSLLSLILMFGCFAVGIAFFLRGWGARRRSGKADKKDK